MSYADLVAFVAGAKGYSNKKAKKFIRQQGGADAILKVIEGPPESA